MERIKLLLTEAQTKILQPLFDSVSDGESMIIGQFHEATEGQGFFEVGIFGGSEAIKLQEATGAAPGSISPVKHEVHADVD